MSRKLTVKWITLVSGACVAAGAAALAFVPSGASGSAAHAAAGAFATSEVHAEWHSDVPNNNVFFDGNRVGIGVVVPGYKLDVRSTSGTALFGWHNQPAGAESGVYGRSNSSIGRGVYGAATRPEGVNYGVRGVSFSPDGYGGYFTGGRGLFGQASNGAFPTSGVRGEATSQQGETTGVYGWSAGDRGRGVVGVAANPGNGVTYAGLFDSHSSSGRGVWGLARTTSGATRGVVGQVRSTSSTARGVLGIAPAGSDAYAIFGQGRIGASIKNFQIDHPLDPSSKWLNHYCTEGQEPLNAYSGNAVLDHAGSAWVFLPEWLESINRDFRYQLTAVGAPAPDLHVAQEIDNNAFLIAGGVPGTKVSWRVEALRDDLYVREFGAPVEVVKPAEARGAYLHPELYGLSPELGLHYERIDEVADAVIPDLEPELDIDDGGLREEW